MPTQRTDKYGNVETVDANFTHGRSGYTNFDCRCRKCKLGNNAMAYERRQRKAASGENNRRTTIYPGDYVKPDPKTNSADCNKLSPTSRHENCIYEWCYCSCHEGAEYITGKWISSRPSSSGGSRTPAKTTRQPRQRLSAG